MSLLRNSHGRHPELRAAKLKVGQGPPYGKPKIWAGL